MKWLFYMVALFMPLYLSAQPAVHGEITRDTRWAGQVFIDGDVIVRPGAVLSIAPGSRIIIEANRDVTRSGRDPQRVELIVLGKLLARGEKGEGKIIFTSSAREPHLGDWYGIVIKNRREPSLLDNCVIEYAHIGVTCYGSSPVLSNSEIRFNHYAGVSCEVRSRAILRRCTLMGNDFAGLVCELASSPIVENSVITQNENGIIIFDRSAPDLGQAQAGENASRGQNRIFNNFEVNIYNQSDREIFAQNNIWNVEDPEEIHQTIVDNADDPGFGQVVIEPMYREAPAPVVARRPSRQPPPPASPPPQPAETLLVTYTPTPSIASNGGGSLA
ncbi:MAG: right-handed parallel beta-helix repeat-containing protein, partial [Calditrichaeota bacterium]